MTENLYNNDCMEIMPTLPSASVDIILVDPSYSYPTNQFRPEARIAQRTFGEFSTHRYFFKQYIAECRRILKSDGDLFIFCDETFYAVLYPLLYENFYQTKMVIWNKKRIGMGGIWRRQFELIIHSYLQPKKERSGDADILDDMVECNPVPSKDRLHFSEKPVELLKKLITKTGKKSGVVMDTFMGSGSTRQAAKELGFDFIGVEVSEQQFALAEKRLTKRAPDVGQAGQ